MDHERRAPGEQPDQTGTDHGNTGRSEKRRTEKIDMSPNAVGEAPQGKDEGATDREAHDSETHPGWCAPEEHSDRHDENGCNSDNAFVR